MAGRIPQSFIDDLLVRVDIVEIIDRYVTLKKAGANYKACCPFHGEKTPSFTVSQTKQFYHCFGCGAHGTAISFLMEHDNMHFIDAIEYLADRVGLEVPRDAVVPVSQTQKALYDTLQHCSQFYQRELRSQQTAIDYLKGRGISGATAGEFELGFAPAGWQALSAIKNTSDNLLQTAGMRVRNDSGKTHDRFRNRVMFPIRDRRGRVIGFGGRVLDNSEPKYLNSPETPLFQKGRELYGLYELRKARSGSTERIIVVEGYMDVISLAQAGIKNAVATLGTATSTEQVTQLFRETNEVVFCFDGDAAGQKAAWRALQSALPALKSGCDARFLFLDNGEDPDTVVQQHGQSFFLELVQQRAVEAAQFLLQELQSQAQNGANETGNSHKARLAELARPLVEQIPSGVYRDLVIEDLEARVGTKVFSDRKPPKVANKPTTTPSPERRPSAVRRAISAILTEPAVVLQIDPEDLDFSLDIPGAALLLEIITLIETQPDISSSGILENYRERPERNSLNKLAAASLDESAELQIDSPLSIARHAIEKMKEETLGLRIKHDPSFQTKAPSELSDQEKAELRRTLQRKHNS